MQERVRPINYHGLFEDHFTAAVDRVENRYLSNLNKDKLINAIRRYDTSKYGYDPQRVSNFMKRSENFFIPASRSSKESVRESSEQATTENIDRFIDTEVKSAGEYVLRQLMRGVRNSINFDIEIMQSYRFGVLDFAEFYSDPVEVPVGVPDEDDSVVRGSGYIDTMEAAWTTIVQKNLNNHVRSIRNTSSTEFDVYETPERVNKEKKNLIDLVSRYDLGTRADAEKAYATVAGIERSMYRQGYNDLISKLSSTDDDINTLLSDTALVVDYGRKAGLSSEKIGASRLEIVTSRLERAATEFDVYETPKRMETARENLRSIAQEFDRLGIISDQEDAKANEIVNRMYMRAFDELTPIALAGIINLDSRNKNVVQDAERALKDVQLTLGYGLRGEIDNNQILDVAHEMLDENSRNDRPHRLAGIVREGVGSEMQRGLEVLDPEGAKSARARGEQLEAEGNVLITMHPTIKAAIEEQIEGIERIEELGRMARIRQSLAGYIDRALERHGRNAQYGYHRRF